MEYYTVKKEGNGEITEKRSRFLARCLHVRSEEDAREYVEENRKKYFDARHHCWAYILGDDKDQQRFSDDGEPSGTAGRPILDVLRSAGLSNCLIIVTRYFGGTLLGTGGLVRAYQAAASAALEEAELTRMLYCSLISVEISYQDLGRLTRFLESSSCLTLPPVFGEKVLQKCLCPEEETASFTERLRDLTCGKAPVSVETQGFFEYGSLS